MAIRAPIFSFLLAFLWASTSSAADLSVIITGLRSEQGTVHVALYDRAEKFPEHEGIFQEAIIPIANGRANALFRDLKPGTYAIATYHDENNNDEFDQGILGIPLEDYGFSNGATAFLGPPAFSEAMIEIPERGLETVIDLGN